MKKAISIILLLLFSAFSFAQKSNLKDLEQQRKIALKEIENTNKLLTDTKTNTASLLNRIKLISNQIETRQLILVIIEQEIESMGKEENKIAEEIVVLEDELSIKKDAYHKAVIGMMRTRQSDSKLIFVLSGRSLTESYRRFKYLKDYSDWRKRQADEIVIRNEELALKQDSLTIAKKGKQSFLKNKENEQGKLKLEEENYKKEINNAKEKEKDLQRILDQKKRQTKALEQQIERLIAEEIIRQEKKAKREKEEAERKAKEAKSTAATTKPTEAKPKTPEPIKPTIEPISTKENLTLSTNFSSNKGKLPYPISGRHTISSRFGVNKQSKWVTTSNGGIDLQSQAGAEAKAVFTGEVTSIVSIPGYGNCVLIRHGNYYTFYGNIQDISIKKGEKIGTGQTIGKVFTDPETNISQMHFQLWERKTKLNPEPWLRK